MGSEKDSFKPHERDGMVYTPFDRVNDLYIDRVYSSMDRRKAYAELREVRDNKFRWFGSLSKAVRKYREAVKLSKNTRMILRNTIDDFLRFVRIHYEEVNLRELGPLVRLGHITPQQAQDSINIGKRGYIHKLDEQQSNEEYAEGLDDWTEGFQ